MQYIHFHEYGVKMVLATFLLINVIVCSVLALPHNVEVRSQRVYNTPENIMSVGYHAETHHATTHDGYVLEMHRIPYRRHSQEGDPNRPVVLLLHGLMAASNSFIALGPEYSIAFNLADAGFDVWMGNARGSRNSRFHVTLDPDSRDERIEFFDFTWEEIGMYDIATMVDYALEQTGQQRLHYIGHSQGGTAFLVLGSMRPEYNDKFATVHLLAGVGHQDYFPQFILRNLARFSDTIWGLALRLGIVEVFPPLSPNNDDDYVRRKAANITDGEDITVTNDKYHLSDFCTGDPTMKDMCELFGIPALLEEISIIDSFGGAAFKQIAHYGQNIRDTSFRRWHYGPEQNLLEYGTQDPPLYDLSLITADVTMHYTVSDDLLDERDVHAMAEIMPNTRVRRVARDSFLHADFVFANDVRELVTEYIIEAILNAQLPSESTEDEDEDDEGDGEGDDNDDDDSEIDSEIDSEEDPEDDSSSHIVLNVAVKFYLIIFSFYCLMSL